MELSALAWHVFCRILGFMFRCTTQLIHLTLRLIKGSKKGMLPPIKDPILLTPAIVLAAQIRTKKVKSETVVRAFIDRIHEINPFLNALVDDRFTDALKDAKDADDYVLKSGKSPEEIAKDKPFLGVPFSTKDAIPIKGLALSAGVSARKGVKAKEDCDVVANMRAAGAIPLCVSNVPEICMWIDASSKPYGTTNNAYDLNRSPGGSSGGEGALISSAASVIGIGNDIGGSIRIPSSFSGIFGHKPTIRVVSNKGQFPCSTGTDLDQFNVTGPMCRYAVDLVPMLKVFAGKNVSKFKLDTKVNMKDVKVYYTEDYITQGFTSKLDPEIRDRVKQVVQQLEKAFEIKAQKVSFPLINKAWSIWLTKIAAAKIEGSSWEDMSVYGEGSSFNLWLEFLKWPFRLSEHTLHYLYYILLCKIYRTEALKTTNQENNILFDKLTKQFKDTLKNDGVFIFPTNANTAMYHQEQIMKLSNFAYTGLFSFLGNPVTQCPTGLSSEGLPLGVQVVSNHHNDHLSLAVAQEIEKITGGWKSPSVILK